MFADDTKSRRRKDEFEDKEKLQETLNEVNAWAKNKLNETKSIQVDITNRRKNNHNIMPYTNSVKYLGMDLNFRLK